MGPDENESERARAANVMHVRSDPRDIQWGADMICEVSMMELNISGYQVDYSSYLT